MKVLNVVTGEVREVERDEWYTLDTRVWETVKSILIDPKRWLNIGVGLLKIKK